MATSIIGMQIKEIKAEWQWEDLPADSSSVSVTANVPSGYNFLCWTQVASVGWIGHVYPEEPNNKITTMWTTESLSTKARRLRCAYLCYK